MRKTQPHRGAATAVLCGTLGGVALAWLAGCGGGEPPGLAIHGDVKFQGQPIDEGVIALLPTSGGPPISGRIQSGQYSIPNERGPAPGKYRVDIEGFRKTGKKIPDMVTPHAPGEQRGMIDERVPYVPAQFNSQSTLTVDVTPDNEKYDFELEP
jgi:hypothetical protein